MTDITPSDRQSFESIRHEDEGVEYWLARQLAPVLGYSDWRNFLAVVEKARVSAAAAGLDPAHDFGDATRMVDIGSGTQREVADVRLSRYACYLIVQNGDPSKPVIAAGQTDAVFQDHGYRGLYGGRTMRDIQALKGLKKSQKILDHMGSTQLAANLFRATQAEDKLKRDGARTKAQANDIHHAVGRKVRKTIEELGGVMPEHLPTPETSIKQLERARQKALKDGGDA